MSLNSLVTALPVVPARAIFITRSGRVYAKLAEIAMALGNERAANSHFFSALTWSPYGDFDLENFLKLIRSLIRIDSYAQAMAAVRQARTRLGSFKIEDNQQGDLMTLDVDECVLLTRLNRPDASLTKGLRIAGFVEPGLPKAAHPDPGGTISWATIMARLSKLLRVGIEHQAAPSSGTGGPRAPATASPTLVDPADNVYQQDLLVAVKQYLQSDHTFQQGLGAQKAELAGIDEVIDAQTTYRENRRSFTYLFQACELYNNIAYNLAQLEIEMEWAIRYSAVAIRLMSRLYTEAREITHRLSSRRLAMLSESLSQYYDTLAWILYRRRTDISGPTRALSYVPREVLQDLAKLGDQDSDAEINVQRTDLQWAIFFIERRSLRYSQHLPVAHYHLSRCYLALAEEQWMDHPPASDGAITALTSSPERNRQLRQYVHKSIRHWQIAQNLNTSGRLNEQLSRQRKRIDVLRKKSRESIERAV